MAHQRDNREYSLHWTIIHWTTVTEQTRLLLSLPRTSSVLLYHLSTVSRGRREEREGRGREGPWISHFPEENDLVMAVKRETEYFSICEVEREMETVFTSWQNIKLGKFLLSDSILANLLFNFGFLVSMN